MKKLVWENKMLLGNKEKTVKLFAENFLWGNLTFDYGTTEDERFGLIKSTNELTTIFREWVKNDSKQIKPDDHKQKTHELYRRLFGWRIRGRLKGILVDVDMENDNAKLKDENIRLKLQNEEYKKDTVTALTELRDKNSLIEQYEKALGIKHP